MRKVILIVILCCATQLYRSQPPQTKTTTRAKRNKTQRSTLSYLQIFMKKQAKYEIAYNPNYGYEPYWADGEWVLTTTTQPRHISTTKKPTICGEECNYLLRRIKHVCAHGSDNNNRSACISPITCLGGEKSILNLERGFKTFSTYCAFLDEQCKAKYHGDRYVLVHIGRCLTQDENFKPLWKTANPFGRVKKYMSTYMDRYYPTTKTKKKSIL